MIYLLAILALYFWSNSNSLPPHRSAIRVKLLRRVARLAKLVSDGVPFTCAACSLQQRTHPHNARPTSNWDPTICGLYRLRFLPPHPGTCCRPRALFTMQFNRSFDAVPEEILPVIEITPNYSSRLAPRRSASSDGLLKRPFCLLSRTYTQDKSHCKCCSTKKCKRMCYIHDRWRITSLWKTGRLIILKIG